MPADICATLVLVKAPEETGMVEVGTPTLMHLGSSGAPTMKSFPIRKEETLVGRGEESDIMLTHLTVSHKHFWVRKTADGFKLVACDSTVNGVLVNGVDVGEVPLHDGDRISFGKYQMVFSCD